MEQLSERPMKNICSEVAVKKILKTYNVNVSIPELKKCESLENMLPCIESSLKKNRRNDIICNFYKIPTIALKSKASQNNPIAIRVVNTDPYSGKTFLHTINVIGYDFKNDRFLYDEENGKKYWIDADKLKKWRFGDYALMCKKKPSVFLKIKYPHLR